MAEQNGLDLYSLYDANSLANTYAKPSADYTYGAQQNPQIGANIPSFMKRDSNMPQANNAGTSWWGKDGYLSTAGNVFGGLGSLAQAYMANKALGLAEDQFAFEKGLAQTNLANQADLTNEQRMNRGQVGLALAGNTMDTEQKQAYLDNITAGNVKRTIG